MIAKGQIHQSQTIDSSNAVDTPSSLLGALTRLDGAVYSLFHGGMLSSNEDDEGPVFDDRWLEDRKPSSGDSSLDGIPM